MSRKLKRYVLAALALSLLVVSSCTKAKLPISLDEIDVVELTAEQIQMDYAQGRYTAVLLTQAFLDRIACYEDHYNAFISMNPEALAVAAALDAEYRSTGPRGAPAGERPLPSTPASPFSASERRPVGLSRTLPLPKRWWGSSRPSDLCRWRGSCR